MIMIKIVSINQMIKLYLLDMVMNQMRSMLAELIRVLVRLTVYNISFTFSKEKREQKNWKKNLLAISDINGFKIVVCAVFFKGR